MPSELTFVIKPSGEFERVETTRNRINPNDAIVESLSAGVTRKAMAVFPMALIDMNATGHVHLAIANRSYVTINMPIRVMPMHAPFAIKDTVAWPDFAGSHPLMKMFWKVPSEMMLYLSLHLSPGYECIEQHLVAFDNKKAAWRLPVSNLYADCRLCHGRYANMSPDLVDACKHAWTQFCNGSWNEDLYADATPQRKEGAKQLFAYKVSDKEITQIEFKGNWTTHCEKVATEYITNCIMPL